MKQNVQIAGNGSAIPTPPEEPGRRNTTAQPNSASASTTAKQIQGGNMMIPPQEAIERIGKLKGIEYEFNKMLWEKDEDSGFRGVPYEGYDGYDYT